MKNAFGVEKRFFPGSGRVIRHLVKPRPVPKPFSASDKAAIEAELTRHMKMTPGQRALLRSNKPYKRIVH